MKISGTAWEKYLDGLRKLDESAYENARERLEGYDLNNLSPGARKAVIDWMYELVGIYGGGSSELACQMYDAIAEASGQILPPAEPAPLPDYAEVAKTVNGTLKTGSPDEVAKGVSRLVKRTGVDTTMQNAIRDGAEWAWVPHGDTCAFCIMLASRGWQNASKKALKNGHAEHIHSHCDCTYAVRFDGKTTVEGYDPDKYLKMYENAEGSTWEEKVNSIRREFYAEDPEKYLAPKREKYRLKTGKMSSGEYYLAKKYWNEVEELDLPQKEREYVYEQFDEWLTDEEKQSAIVRKAIGNYYYQAVHLGHNQYKIFIKERIVPYEDWFDEVMTEVIGPDWRRYDF